MNRQLLHVTANILGGAGRKSREGHHVTVGNKTKRKVDPTGLEILDVETETSSGAVIHALDAVEKLTLPLLSPKNLQRSVFQPLLKDDRSFIAEPSARNELKQRALAQ